MARLSVEKAEQFKVSEGEFFSLKNDKDTATVRLLYENKDQLDIYAVHEVTVNGKKRWVECLQTDDCPGCKKDGYPVVRLFIKLHDYRDKKYKIWERGQKMIPKLVSRMEKYGPLVNRPYEIERQGKAGDTKTEYEIFALDKDNKSLADFEKQDELLGSLILVKNKVEFNELLSSEPQEDEEPKGSEPQKRGNTGRDVF